MTAITKTALVTAPASRPITAADLKTHLWTIYPEKTTDAYLEGLIDAAVSHIEQVTWRKIVSQTWRLYLDDWPCAGGEIRLPFGHVSEINSFSWIDDEGTTTALVEDTDYITSIADPEPKVIPVDSWPSGNLREIDAIRIEFTCGWAVADIPQAIVHAIMLLVSHWYENREAVIVGTTVRNVPLAFESLINPWKLWVP